MAHIDKHRKGKRKLVASSGKVMEKQPSSFQNYADVFAKLGYPVQMDFTSLFSEEGGDLSLFPEQVFQVTVDNSKNKSTVINKDAHNPAEPWIGLAPFAAHEGKIYPVQQMEKVIERLIHNHPHCRIFLFGGGKTETPVMDAWEEKYPQVVNASGKLHGISDELILMSHLRLMISMDSGNMHLGILGQYTCGKYLGSHPSLRRFHGLASESSNAVQLDMPCRPCSIYGNKPA